MIKIAVGIIVGFVVWSILWIGSDLFLAILSPNWYGKILNEYQAAVAQGEQYSMDSIILVISLMRGIFFSIIAGFLGVLISKEKKTTAFSIGILLLIVGITMHLFTWTYLPLWYHMLFLIMLIPMTILGGKLRKQEPLV